MGIRIKVLAGEKFRLGYLWHAVYQQTVVVKNSSGNQVFNRNSWDHPGPGTWEMENTSPNTQTFTIEAFFKDTSGPMRRADLWHPNAEKELNRVRVQPTTILITIGTEDGGDGDYYDTVVDLLWQNSNRTNDPNFYEAFASEPF